MRREMKKNKEEMNIKIIKYSGITIAIIAVIAFGILIYSKKLNNDVKEGTLMSEQLSSILNNTNTASGAQNTESASTEIGKSVNEMSNELKQHMDLQFKTSVQDILVEDHHATGIVLENGQTIHAKKVVLAPGRDGSAWLTKVLSNQGLKLYNNQVDIGVRVETSNIVMEEINKNLYEGKFVYNTSVGTKVRTFCSNPSGHVVIENHSGTMLANGHAYHDPKLGSKNTNFALLVSHTFSEPFNEPNEFAHEISRLANKLSNGSVIVQRYGDII